jgi:Zinc finger, C3HC4 type (RING finger)
LTSVERQKAQQLQKEFRTRCCPICLESLDYGECGDALDKDIDEIVPPGDSEERNRDMMVNHSDGLDNESLLPCKGAVDEFGIPRRGADGKKIKMLRCGHIFCETCWKSWVHSGCGNPCNCPVCRQDVGKSVCRSKRQQQQQQHQQQQHHQQVAPPADLPPSSLPPRAHTSADVSEHTPLFVAARNRISYH